MNIWFIEVAKAIGKIFMNPLLYWGILLVVLAGFQRIRKERYNFGLKVFDLFSEWKNTWTFSLATGLLLSIIFLGIGFVITYETILLLSIVTIILSAHLRFTLLSPSYTIGATFLLMLLLPLFEEYFNTIDLNIFSFVNFNSLPIILGLLLLVESFLLLRMKRNDVYPELSLSNRGVWIGQHRLKKLSIIPFFILIPTGPIESFMNFWPYFSIGEQTYSLLFVPFILGIDYKIRGNQPQFVAKTIGKYIRLLGIVTILVAVGGIFLPWLSIMAVVLGIIGKEFINYRFRVFDKNKQPFFNQMDKGLKVLSIIPGTPADRLGILVGETISKVNGQQISTTNEFYEALQASGASFKLEILDDQQEIRFVQSAFYDNDHHKLGIIFTDKPYRHEKIG